MRQMTCPGVIPIDFPSSQDHCSKAFLALICSILLNPSHILHDLKIKSIFVSFDGNYHNCHRRKSGLHKHNATCWAKNKIDFMGFGGVKVMILDQLLGGIGEILKRNHNTVANRKVLRRNITKPSRSNAAKVGPSCCFIAQSKCVARRVTEHLLCLRFIKV